MTLPHTPFYFIRHGETDWNREQRYMGSTDIPLNALGREQAARAALALKDEPITHIVTSPLLRAAETASIIGEILQTAVTIIDGLQELNHGGIEGQPIDGAQLLFERWHQGEVSEGAETVQQFDARILEATKRALVLPGPVLIVSHGGVYYAMRRILQASPPEHPNNCASFYHAPPQHPTHPWILCEVGNSLSRENYL